VHPRGESKKFNIARGESKEKKLQGKKQNSPTLQGYQPIYPKNNNIIFVILKYNLFQIK
jgi:hypothetical protein